MKVRMVVLMARYKSTSRVLRRLKEMKLNERLPTEKNILEIYRKFCTTGSVSDTGAVSSNVRYDSKHDDPKWYLFLSDNDSTIMSDLEPDFSDWSDDDDDEFEMGRKRQPKRKKKKNNLDDDFDAEMEREANLVNDCESRGADQSQHESDAGPSATANTSSAIDASQKGEDAANSTIKSQGEKKDLKKLPAGKYK
jgi:hypothetical protein